MKNKSRMKRGIMGIALAAIMTASIFALAAPTVVANHNPSVPGEYYPDSTIRIYGDVYPRGNAPERYSDWIEPFNPTVIPKDSITFNPAILEWDMSAQSTNANEKIYLRAWYEPCGKYWGPIKNHTYPTINLEYTYMLIDEQDKLPWHGDAGNTTFAFPICAKENQTGLGAFENTFEKPLSMAATPNLVLLAHVGGDVYTPYNKTVNGTIAIQKKYFIEPGEIIQFLDHKLEYVGTDQGGNFSVVRVWYTGNREDDSAKLVILPKSQPQYFKRHNEMSSTFSRDYPWFAHFEFKMQDTHLMAIDVGRYLWNCSVFYVDGVRYDVTAVEVLDWDGEITNGAEKFKYITLRTKLPKGTGEVMDESRVSSQYIDCIEKKEILPVLPPFNMNHSIVDDINVPLWAPLKNLDKWPNGDPDGVLGTEHFPCAEKYVTMQYPPAQWLKFFRAVPIGVPDIPSDWQLWENYGGPFYPGDDLPPYWVMDVCGKQLPAPGEGNYTVFDPTHWIALDVGARIIPDVEPLVVYYLAEAREQRFSTNLLEKLNESYIGTSRLSEEWTKFDIQTLPDMYTEFVLPEIPDVNAKWRIINEPEPRKMLDEYGMFYGDYLITTSLIAPNSLSDRPMRGGDFPGARVAFSYDMKEGMEGTDLYVNSDAKDRTKNVTVRIYGDVYPAAPHRYTDWEEPFNPTVIKKDSITFDAAKLEWDGSEYPMSAQSTDADLKEYLRAWYEPCYNFSKGKKPAVVTETTYMLLDHQDEKPWHGSANNTWFAFPIAEDESTEQIGLELFENKAGMPATPNLVKLAHVSALDDPVGAYNKSVKGKIRLEKKYYMEDGHAETVQFFDHKVKYLGTNEGGTIAVLRVGYAGNKADDTWTEVHVPQGQTVWLDRHQNIYSGPQHKDHPVRTFYIRFEFKMQDMHLGVIEVGKELEWCDVFYVDGVRYEVMAIEVLDLDGDEYAEKFKYLTLKTPFAKGTGTFDDSSADPGYGESSIYISKIPPCPDKIPVLPPMSMEHLIVDDTDVALWQPLKHLDKWPKGDPNGVPGKEFFPCAERYLTVQYPPYPWLKFFRAVPIDTDRDMQPLMPTDWEIWENYGGPFYPGDEVPDNWTLCTCGIKMYGANGPGGAKYWTVFDNEHWIANDVNERVIGPIGPLEFCWLNETKEPRYSTNLLQILDENVTGTAPVEEGWTKYDIQTLPDMYTEFKLPVIPSVKPRVYIGGDFQDYFKPDMREYLGSYLITTSFWAPNAEGDFNLNQTYQQGNRFAFTFNASDGVGIYMNEDPPATADLQKCTQPLNLKKGKDYISIYAIPEDPEDASPGAVFGAGVEVFGYDPVTGWYTPTTVEGGKGYLVRSPEPKTRDVNGTNVVGRTWAGIKAELHSGGWNLVGIGDTDVKIGDDVEVIGWDAVTDKWFTLGKDEELERGKGYWIEWPQ